MNADKIFYGTWAAVIIMIGACLLIGNYLLLNALETFSLWFLCVGAILFIVGIISIKLNRKSANIQMIIGVFLVALSSASLSIFLGLLDAYVSLAIILIVVGIIIVFLGISKKR